MRTIVTRDCFNNQFSFGGCGNIDSVYSRPRREGLVGFEVKISICSSLFAPTNCSGSQAGQWWLYEVLARELLFKPIYFYLSSYLFIYIYLYIYIYLSIRVLSIYLYTCIFSHQSFHMSIYPSIYLYLYLSIYLSVYLCLSIYSFIYLSFYHSIYISIHLSINLY